MRKILISGIMCTMLLMGGGCLSAQAAFEPSLEAAYNTAVQGQDMLDGLNVTVMEKIVSSQTNAAAQKQVDLKLSGIRSDYLKADIKVTTDEGSAENYYREGYYYTTTSDGKVKREMDRSSIWDIVNAHTYIDLTSNYLKMLCSETADDGSVTYRFAATPESLGDYSKKLLEGAGNGQGIVIDSLQGTMLTDQDGHVESRAIQMVYTVTNGDQSETFLMNTDVEFRQIGEAVNVALPDLTEYKTKEAEKPVETLTPLSQQVYVTTDVNVRAAGNLSAVILGGVSAGGGIMETGYTSDGWIQVQYNGAAGYIWGEYVTTKKPVITKSGSGIMYATADVNVRNAYDSSGAVLGVLSKGSSIEMTGTTDNGWVRVKYNGQTGYVYADYLSWEAPIADTYVENGYMSGIVTDASLGVLTIQRDDGQGSESFNTSYAQMNFKDTLCTGDWVEVLYYGAGAPYTASVVNDYTRHNAVSEAKSVSVEGVVVELSSDTMKILGTDGVYRTFDILWSDFEMTDGLYEGKYVTVSWMSSTNGAETKNIEALRVRG